MPASGEKLGEIYVEIHGKLDKLEKQMKGLRGDAEKRAGEASKGFSKKFAAGLVGAMGAIYALKKAWDFAVQAKNAARDAKETDSKFRTVFENIEDYAVDAADAFASAFGVASTTAKDLLGNTGDLLVGFGFTEDAALDLSLQVNELAQDLASFTNFQGGAKGASLALTKGILGETESVKALGIVLRQNTPEFKEAMRVTMESQRVNENQARAMVLLKEAYRQSGKAVGDYNRTKDEQANMERRLNEEHKATLELVGNGLLPAFNGLTKAGIGWLKVISEIWGIEQKINGGLVRQKALRESLTGATEAYIKGEMTRAQIQLNNIQADILAIEAGRKIFNAQTYGLGTIISDALFDEDERLGILKAQTQALKEQLEVYDKILNGTESTTTTTASGAPARPSTDVAPGLIKKVKDEIEKLEKSKPFAQTKEATAAINIKLDELKKKLEHLNNLGLTVDADYVNVDEDIDWLNARIEKEEEAARKKADLTWLTADNLRDSGGEFESSMMDSLGMGVSLANVLQGGLFKAGSTFVDHMTDAFNVVNSVIGLLASVGKIASGGSMIPSFASDGSFTVPPGHLNDPFPKAVQSGEHVSVTPANQASQTDQLLREVNGSIQAMNMNLMNKNMSTTVNVGLDSKTIARDVVAPGANRLLADGVNTND